MQKNGSRLEQLTSLRFFAALAIVFHHLRGEMGVPDVNIGLGQGVSFFFVLSGFILAYVYPHLPDRKAIAGFWRARIARIWPAHVASFLLGWWLLGYEIVPATVVAYLALVQAWIPSWNFYFSYNAVAWSISTEFFFYLCFPFLLHRWSATWRVKLAGGVLLLLVLVWACSALALPALVPPNGGAFQPSQHGVLYISPFGRLLEFIVGMAAAHLFQTRRYTTGKRVGTALEIGVLLLCVLNVIASHRVIGMIEGVFPAAPINQWIGPSSSLLSFAALIYVMAHGHGRVSALLQVRPLVLLGEISFSMYLVHQILIGYLSSHKSGFSRVGGYLDLVVFFGVLVLLSYLMWRCIELPARAVLTGSARSIRLDLKKSLGPASAALLLWITLATVFTQPGGADFISEREASLMTPASLAPHTGSVFGKRFELRGLDVRCLADGIELDFAWQSRMDQPFGYMNALHLVDAGGAILAQQDYGQPTRSSMVKAGQIWKERVFLSAGRLQPSMTSIALAVYRGADLLAIDKGNTDWGGRRLIIPLPECQSQLN